MLLDLFQGRKPFTKIFCLEFHLQFPGSNFKCDNLIYPRRLQLPHSSHWAVCCYVVFEMKMKRFKCKIFQFRYLFVLGLLVFVFDQNTRNLRSFLRHYRAYDLPISCYGGTEQLKITLN